MTIDWPTKDFRFWWMQYKQSARSKTRVMLVELVTHDGTEFIQPFQDNNCYPKSFCVEWNARFKPCTSEPIFNEGE